MKISQNYQSVKGAPQWFKENICQTPETICTQVAGAKVHFLAWNWQALDLPTIMFVHGFGAHAYWWAYLAPFFSKTFRVVAIDLPGMGRSEPPSEYREDSSSRAITGIIQHYRLAPVTIIGHSYGGAQSLRAVATNPELFHRILVVDTNIRLTPEPLIRRLKPKGQHRMNASLKECMERFRLVPPQINSIKALEHFIAYHSCAFSNGGWHWRTDPNCVNSGEIETEALLKSVSIPVDMIFGEKSFLNVDDKPTRVFQHFPQAGELRFIANAGHHVMLDCPLQLVAEIRSLLEPDPALNQ
ncbi:MULTISPECIES: alpha/beta fold hydrolase [unclassified Ketobacter]|uniref:alpha/beta fold hydrolase n=1 Tax=unclassified Ketobacter TaxID=2639109 RepID=UPI000F1B6CD3|nr:MULTISPECIES: alpha/beta hydrolase [unclassified Ketobacter]RLT90199.1 MAG: alpha/beta hydrolase [Ketobacter sp. GenoA1]RLT93604.1 MAG: alpha/beta hydrolase [Ketobacter sp.]